MKAMREGCLAGEEGADLLTGPSTNGDAEDPDDDLVEIVG